MSDTEPAGSNSSTMSPTPLATSVAAGTHQFALGTSNVVVTAGNGSPVNIYTGEQIEPSAERVRFGPWRRKSKSITKGLEKHVDLVNQRLENYGFAVVRTRLSTIAEDIFEIAIGTGSVERVQEAVLSRTGGRYELAFETLLDRLDQLEDDCFVIVDLHAATSAAQVEILHRIRAETSQLTSALRRQSVRLVLASPPLSDISSKDRFLVSLTYAEEEELLVLRAADVEDGQNGALLVSALRAQLPVFWGDETDRLRSLDEAIRAGTIAARIRQYAERLGQVKEETENYRSKMLKLIEFSPDALESYAPAAKPATGSARSVLTERALFLLTTFEELDASEFDALMTTLLAGVTVTETQYHLPQQPASDGTEVRTSPAMRVDERVDLSSVYRANPDAILALLDVQCRESGELSFEPAFKAGVAREVLRTRKPVLLNKLLIEETVDRAMLFDLPLRLAEQLADRYAEFATGLAYSRQQAFIERWIDRSIHHFISDRIPSFQLPQSGDVPEVKLLLEAINEHVSREYARELCGIYTERAALLLTKLLSDAKTKDLVEFALERLMEEGRDAPGKHELILMFIRELRSQKEFQALRWLKRLLSEGDAEAKRNSLNYLANLIEWGTQTERTAVLEELWAWKPSERVDNLNNRSAALLAPYVTMHRAFARTKERDHGQVDQVPPLFDLQNENGLFPDHEAWTSLLRSDVRGDWTIIGVDIFRQLVEARWGAPWEAISSATAADQSRRSPGTASRARNDELMFVGVLTEAIAVLLKNPDGAPDPRRRTVEQAVRTLAGTLARDSLSELHDTAYAVAKVLGRSPSSTQASRRGRCANFLGDIFYLLHRDGPRTSAAASVRGE